MSLKLFSARAETVTEKIYMNSFLLHARNYAWWGESSKPKK